MAVVVPLRWQGAARAARLRARVDELTRAWLAGWVSRGSESVAVAVFGQAPRAIGAELRVARAGDRCVFATTAPQFFEQLGARLAEAGFDALQGPEVAMLASGIGRRAFDDWMRTLLGAPADIESADRGECASAQSERHGAVHLECTIQGLRCELCLDVTLCDALVPPERTAQGRLRPLQEALGTQAVTLEVVLDLGQATLAETLALTPGDIVKTQAPLASLLRLQASGGRTVASGVLAAADAQRAFRISHLHASKVDP